MTDIVTINSAHAMPDRLKAILLMCSAVTLFSCLDTTAKYLGTRMGLPAAQIIWVRFAGQVLMMAIIAGPAGTRNMFRANRLGLQLTRSFLMAATTACNFIAVRYLRLDQTISITFLAPLLVAALAGPLLGEHIGWHRALAIVAGFIGILVVVRPGFAAVHPAFAVAFAAMLAYSLFLLVTRMLAAHDAPLVTLWYSMMFGLIGGAFFAIPQWVWPADWYEWLLLAALGVFGGSGHFLLVHAYRLAPASSVSPILYFQLLSMTALGFVVFGDMPDRWSLVGASIVIASGLYLVHRERVVSSREHPRMLAD